MNFFSQSAQASKNLCRIVSSSRVNGGCDQHAHAHIKTLIYTYIHMYINTRILQYWKAFCCNVERLKQWQSSTFLKQHAYKSCGASKHSATRENAKLAARASLRHACISSCWDEAVTSHAPVLFAHAVRSYHVMIRHVVLTVQNMYTEHNADGS